MSSFAQTLRGLLERSFVMLPFLLFTWALFIGSTTGNIGLIVLAMGHATVVPLATWGLNYMMEKLGGEFGKTNFTMQSSAVCNLLPTGFTNVGQREYVVPSYWLAHIIFFFTFLFANASAVLHMPAAPNASEEKVERRKSQAQLVQITSVVFLILFLVLRFFFMGCELVVGLLVGGLVFTGLGYAWFEVARQCSARDSDVFGIVQGILPPAASDPPPMTCVYTKA